MKLNFPKEFIFGVADADIQVVGEDHTRNIENSQETMWNKFSKSSGKVFKNHTPGPGIDRYHMWKEDVGEMRKMGIQHYRTSVSMARTLTPTGEVNTSAIKWYKDYFSELKKAGIKIYVTLYHWELPLFLQEMGGWENQTANDWFIKHAETVYKNLGEYIEEYFILNEPWVSSHLGYHQGIFAPGKKDLKMSLQVAHNLLLAQARVYRRLRALDKKIKISTVVNLHTSYAYSTDKNDLLAAQYNNGYINSWFLDPLYLGKYPEIMVKLFGKNMPKFSAEDMKEIRIGEELHALGINYYNGGIEKYNDASDIKVETVQKKGALKTDLGWPITTPPHYQQGLYDLLSQTYFTYKEHGLEKLYVAENGIALNTAWNKKDKVIKDAKRIDYLQEHIKEVYESIIRGVPVEAYFEWTLMDNFEWAFGYKPDSCFGLIHVDRKTMKRVWKESAFWYSKLIKSKTLTI